MLKTIDVVRAAARVTKIQARDIVSRSRRQHLVETRIAIGIVARRAGRSTTQIGRVLNRDHSTICQNQKKHGQRNSIISLAADIELEIIRQSPLLIPHATSYATA